MHWFLITCLISLQDVSCISKPSLQPAVSFFTPAYNQHWTHYLFLRPSSNMYCPFNQHTYYIHQHPLSPAHTYTSGQSSVCTWPLRLCFSRVCWAPAFTAPWGGTASLPTRVYAIPLCVTCVCMCVVFSWLLSLMVLPYSAEKLDPQ